VKYLLGLDLGQAADPTALAILERIVLPAQSVPAVGGYAGPPIGVRTTWTPPAPPKPRCRFECPHLERLTLGTAYPDVVTRVAGLLEDPALAGAEVALVVDATGVGRPVVDMFRQAHLDPIAITITGGDTVTCDGAGFRVPKRDLVGVVQVLLQSERMKFAAGLPAIPQLVQEFLAFRVKIDPLTAHDSYGAWREGAHDDLVLAVAVAAWYGEHWSPPPPRRHLGSQSWGPDLSAAPLAGWLSPP
jgi:hypothetical protein